LANGDFNVIVVHWGGGSSVEYNQAHANIRLVGLEIAFLVNTMVVSYFALNTLFIILNITSFLSNKAKLGAKASDMHLIGHSLGAHTAGYAGEKIPNLGQITGLLLVTFKRKFLIHLGKYFKFHSFCRFRPCRTIFPYSANLCSLRS
jgi:pancreatic triacylglycerol lipase